MMVRHASGSGSGAHLCLNSTCCTSHVFFPSSTTGFPADNQQQVTDACVRLCRSSSTPGILIMCVHHGDMVAIRHRRR